jgi:zinc protease
MVNMRIEKPLLDTEMTVVRNEFERGENQPARILEERVFSTMYLWHNYGKSTIGSKADIEKVPIDKLAEFYRKYYQPDNAVLVIAGQFDTSKALAMVADTCGAIPRPARKLDETYTVEPAQDGERYIELRRVGDNPVVDIAWHAPAMAHPDAAALEVMSGIMSGGGRGGSTGRLYKALVDNKKATSVRMEFGELHDPGMVLVTATLSKDMSLDEARKTIIDTVSSVVAEPPTREEVEREKARILQGMEQNMSNSQRAALNLSEVIADGDWRLLFTNYDQIKKVTPDDVVRAAKLYFKASNRTVGEFIPTPDPDRTEVPAAPSLDSLFSGFQTSLNVSQGDAFDPTPAAIEKRITRSKLPNGMKIALLAKTTRGGTVVASFDFRFGDLSSLSGKEAVGGITGALLMRGTKTRSRQQIQDEMVKLNARINVGGGFSVATASIQTTSENLVPAMRLVADMLRNSVFPDSEFDTVKKQRVTGIENGRSDPGQIATRALTRTLSPYPRTDPRYTGTVDENLDDVNKVTLDDVKKFYAQFYGASHGQMVVVGQFDMAAVQKGAAELFGDWTNRAPYKRISGEYRKIAPTNVKIEAPDKADATWAAGLNIEMNDADPDYPAMVLANFMFGGSITSRMEDRIRNREGLSYGAQTGFSANSEGNLARFQARATANPANMPKLEAIFKEELAKAIAEGFTDKEIAEAKKSFHDQRVVGRSQDAQLVSLIATREDFGRTLDWDAQMDAKVEALTTAQINAAFRKRVDPVAVTIIKSGDFKKVGAYQ